MSLQHLDKEERKKDKEGGSNGHAVKDWGRLEHLQGRPVISRK